MGPSSEDCRLLIWLSWNRFLCMQYPKNSVFFFKDGPDVSIESSFLKAKFAHFLTWREWLHLFDDLPSDVEVNLSAQPYQYLQSSDEGPMNPKL